MIDLLRRRSKVAKKDRLSVVWIPDAMVMDENTLPRHMKWCADHGLQVLVEMTGTKPITGERCIMLKDRAVVPEGEQA